MRFDQNVQLSLMSSPKISYVSQFHQNCIQQHQKRQSYIQTQSLRPGEVARAHQILSELCSGRLGCTCQTQQRQQTQQSSPETWQADQTEVDTEAGRRQSQSQSATSHIFLCRFSQKATLPHAESMHQKLNQIHTESNRNQP